MHQLDYVAETKWQNLLATKPTKMDVVATQDFVVGASILVQKWQDCLDNYENFYQ
jgi:hypothetical protein